MAAFPKVDGPSGRGLRQPPGLSPLGCQGSACERLRLTGRLRACRPRELYSIAPLGRYGALRRPFVCRLSAAKTFPSGEARFACFPFAPKARLFGLIIRGGLHHL